MKLFSFLIFSSLISFMSNLDASLCSPDYLNGDVNPYICSRLPTASSDNECCMIYFTGEDEASYRVCFEMTARMIIHFNEYKSQIEKLIDEQSHFYVFYIDNYSCSSKFIKVSFLALLLVLF